MLICLIIQKTIILMLSVVSNIYPLILGKIISIHSSQTLLTFSVNAANLLSLSHLSSPWPHTLYFHLQYLLHRCTIKFNLISLFHFERRSFWSLYYDFPQPEQSGIGLSKPCLSFFFLYASITLPSWQSTSSGAGISKFKGSQNING